MAEQPIDVALQDMRAMIHALKMSGLSFVEPDAQQELLYLIQKLPSPEELNTLSETPEQLKKVREEIGYIMGLVDAYGYRGPEFKARYISKTDLPPRYKVLEWSQVMKEQARATVKELVRLSAVADEKGQPKAAKMLLTCAKNIQNNSSLEDTMGDIEQAAFTLQLAGLDEDAHMARTAQASINSERKRLTRLGRGPIRYEGVGSFDSKITGTGLEEIKDWWKGMRGKGGAGAGGDTGASAAQPGGYIGQEIGGLESIRADFTKLQELIPSVFADIQAVSGAVKNRKVIEYHREVMERLKKLMEMGHETQGFIDSFGRGSSSGKAVKLEAWLKRLGVEDQKVLDFVLQSPENMHEHYAALLQNKPKMSLAELKKYSMQQRMDSVKGDPEKEKALMEEYQRSRSDFFNSKNYNEYLSRNMQREINKLKVSPAVKEFISMAKPQARERYLERLQERPQDFMAGDYTVSDDITILKLRGASPQVIAYLQKLHNAAAADDESRQRSWRANEFLSELNDGQLRNMDINKIANDFINHARGEWKYRPGETPGTGKSTKEIPPEEKAFYDTLFKKFPEAKWHPPETLKKMYEQSKTTAAPTATASDAIDRMVKEAIWPFKKKKTPGEEDITYLTTIYTKVGEIDKVLKKIYNTLTNIIGNEALIEKAVGEKVFTGVPEQDNLRLTKLNEELTGLQKRFMDMQEVVVEIKGIIPQADALFGVMDTNNDGKADDAELAAGETATEPGGEAGTGEDFPKVDSEATPGDVATTREKAKEMLDKVTNEMALKTVVDLLKDYVPSTPEVPAEDLEPELSDEKIIEGLSPEEKVAYDRMAPKDQQEYLDSVRNPDAAMKELRDITGTAEGEEVVVPLGGRASNGAFNLRKYASKR